MRRQVITQAAPSVQCAFWRWLPKLGHLAQQQVNLLLLARNDLVQMLNQVFGVGGLDFKIRQALFCGVWICHTSSIMKIAIN